jgi:hypothetical protein
MVCESPAEIWLNVPTGGVAWPLLLSPQQTTLPSVFNPQL